MIPGGALKPGSPRTPKASGDVRVKAQLDMAEMDLEDELRRLQKRRIPPNHRKTYIKQLLFELRHAFKLGTPDTAKLMASNFHLIAARLASIEDVKMLLRGPTGKPAEAAAAEKDGGASPLVPPPRHKRTSGAERIIGRLVASVRTKRRRNRIPSKRCWFLLLKVVSRETMLEHVLKCECVYANSAEARAHQVASPMPARRSLQERAINGPAKTNQASIAMRRASRVIQHEAMQAVHAQMLSAKNAAAKA